MGRRAEMTMAGANRVCCFDQNVIYALVTHGPSSTSNPHLISSSSLLTSSTFTAFIHHWWGRSIEHLIGKLTLSKHSRRLIETVIHSVQHASSSTYNQKPQLPSILKSSSRTNSQPISFEISTTSKFLLLNFRPRPHDKSIN